MDYRASLNFLDQRGIIDANSARRFGLGLNYNQRLANDRLSLRFSVRGSRTDDRFTPLGVLSNAAQYGPTQPIDDPAAPTGFYDWPGNSSTSADNPVAILNLAEEKAETYRAIGNMQTEYRLPWVRRPPSQPDARLRRERRRAAELSPERPPPGAGDRKGRPTDTIQSAADQHRARELPQLHHAASCRVRASST